MSQHFQGQGDFIGVLSVPSVVTNCGQVDVSDLRDGHKNIKSLVQGAKGGEYPQVTQMKRICVIRK